MLWGWHAFLGSKGGKPLCCASGPSHEGFLLFSINLYGSGYGREWKAAQEVGAVPPARDDGRAWGDGCQLLGLAGWEIQGDTTGKLKPGTELCFSAFLHAGESFHS